jgi:signal transduction histidine kinase
MKSAHSRVIALIALLKNLPEAGEKRIQEIILSAEELQDYLIDKEEMTAHYEERVNSILNTLLRFTVMDFSQRASISELGDDLDAIAVGINTLAEELEYKITQEAKNAEQLREQNLRLERMNKELASFAYVSSHDLQEPLRKINTYISRIMDEEADKSSEQMKFYLQRIHASASRMQKLIADILDYSRISNPETEAELVDLRVLAEECREDFEESLKEKNAVFEFDALCRIRIVPFQFKRLLNNLIGNSIKFADKSRPLRITMKSKTDAGSAWPVPGLSSTKKYCHIRFEDNGIGFEAEYNEKVFEVFQRLHDKDEYQGTGVGLAICKRIVENHGGTITASGRAGQGVTFDIYLPV